VTTASSYFYRPTPPPDPVLSVENDSGNSAIVMYQGKSEILKVAEDGFYVRGVKVPDDENEAAAVYKAFKAFLVYHGLTRDY
jgi:hypothetical protein